MTALTDSRSLVFAGLFALLPVTARAASPADGVRVPAGFEATLYADDDLAHDVYAMTVDSLGRVVVSGAGYVRILIDDDGDGRADRFQEFADGPKTGAQGMFFHGRDLLCVGDAGLIRYRDRDGDDRADGPPDVFLRVRTGGEHHAHAVRKGPDGWWYLIAGNDAGVDAKYATLASSPITRPAAGVLLRLKPDLSGGELLTDGVRTAYDFDFHPQGDMFVYDSDDEREVSLPSYRPTRVFQAAPGANAGWITKSWRRPDEYIDMPPVVAAFGRGSPTGVECYRHRQFPAEYHGAVFVLDWTFGRVMALPLRRDGAGWSCRPVEFMTNVGQFGFAPTDAAVGPDGSLFVSVGGRGTRGGVFRVTYKGASVPAASEPRSPQEQLAACVDAPQPLSSWSRARWEPLATGLGREVFAEVARNVRVATPRRVRAIEILTELHGGLGGDAAALAGDPSAEVRARAAWSLGRTPDGRPVASLLLPFLQDRDPLVSRFALEALLGVDHEYDAEPLLPAVAARLADEDRAVRATAARVAARLRAEDRRRLAELAATHGTAARLSLALASALRPTDVNLDALAVGLDVLGGDAPVPLQRDAVRVMVLALGDVGGDGKLPAAFGGYASRVDLAPHERDLDTARARVGEIYPTGDTALDGELARLAAVLAPYNPALLDRVLANVTADSHPVDDVHHLTVAACVPVERTAAQRDAIARGLTLVEPKIRRRKLNQDSHWDERIAEIYKRHADLDPLLPVAVVERPEFGRPAHVIYMSRVPQDLRQRAVDAFAAEIARDADYPWSTDVVFLLGASEDPRHVELIRGQFGNFAVRSAVLMALAERPDAPDREKFVEGLDGSPFEVLVVCLGALEKLPASREPAEQFALLRTLRRLGSDKREFPARETAARLLARNTEQDFGFIFGDSGHRPQPEAIARAAEWLASQYPDEAARLRGGEEQDLAALRAALAEVDWEAGDADRGAKLFESRSCGRCHGGRQALGPDLAGVANRFSRDDLFTAIALPDRDVSPRYQTTLVQTTEGQVHTGLVIYESVDGVILRTGQNQTFRIEGDEIEERRTLSSSLMPSGLLKDLRPRDLADLYAYLLGQGK